LKPERVVNRLGVSRVHVRGMEHDACENPVCQQRASQLSLLTTETQTLQATIKKLQVLLLSLSLSLSLCVCTRIMSFPPLTPRVAVETFSFSERQHSYTDTNVT